MRISAMMLIFSLMLTSCVVADRRGGGLEIIPILPVTVDLDEGDYYAYGGYHYFYTDDRWVYSRTLNGPRMDLPRDHWPRETHRRGNSGRGRGEGNGR